MQVSPSSSFEMPSNTPFLAFFVFSFVDTLAVLTKERRKRKRSQKEIVQGEAPHIFLRGKLQPFLQAPRPPFILAERHPRTEPPYASPSSSCAAGTAPKGVGARGARGPSPRCLAKYLLCKTKPISHFFVVIIFYIILKNSNEQKKP